MELSSQGIAHYKRVGKSMLVLLPPESVGIVGATTTHEASQGVCGEQFLPGLIYQGGYFPLSIPVRMGVTAIDLKIPSTYDNYTRYLDLRNGGVIRWNKGFADDYGEAKLSEIDGKPVLEYTSGGVTVDMDMMDENIMFKIIRENTGLVALDDVDFLNMMLMIGLCLTWMGGRLFECGKGLLCHALRKAGASEIACEIAQEWEDMATEICGWCTVTSNSVEKMDPQELATQVGMTKEMARLRCVAPARSLRNRFHWCSKQVPRLEMFKTVEVGDYQPGETSHGPQTFNEMMAITEIRSKLLAALDFKRKETPDDFDVQEYVRSKIPIS